MPKLTHAFVVHEGSLLTKCGLLITNDLESHYRDWEDINFSDDHKSNCPECKPHLNIKTRMFDKFDFQNGYPKTLLDFGYDAEGNYPWLRSPHYQSTGPSVCLAIRKQNKDFMDSSPEASIYLSKRNAQRLWAKLGIALKKWNDK